MIQRTDTPATAGSHGGRGGAGAHGGPTAAPSARSLVKATAISLVIAAIVLVVAVLPAEYGIDPTGAGRALGLMNLFGAGQAAQAAPAPITPAQTGPVFRQLNDYRVDTRQFTLPPKGGIEFKYQLDRGATILYSWKATAFVDYDFHTEPAGKPPEASDSFDRSNAAQLRGAYVAPYAGIHGWYWENPTDREVTVTLTTAGFYSSAKLFQPSGVQDIQIPERPDGP